MTFDPKGAICSLCTAPLAVKKHGYCWAHYLRFKRHGHPEGGKQMRRPGAPIEHGTHAGYVAGCRCAECTEAVRLYGAERRARFARGEFDLRHGVWSTYCVGCRCRDCRRNASERRHREREARYERFRRGLLACEHGVWRTYSEFGCRCAECSAAFRVEMCQYDGRRRKIHGPPAPRRARRAVLKLRRSIILAEIEIAARNHAYRQEQLAAAIDSADDELAALIAEQQRDRFDREQGAWVVSFDAHVFEDGTDRYEAFGDPWDDPTFDAVLESA